VVRLIAAVSRARETTTSLLSQTNPRLGPLIHRTGGPSGGRALGAGRSAWGSLGPQPTELVGSSGRPFQAPDQPDCSIEACSVPASTLHTNTLHTNTLHTNSSHISSSHISSVHTNSLHSSSVHAWGADWASGQLLVLDQRSDLAAARPVCGRPCSWLESDGIAQPS